MTPEEIAEERCAHMSPGRQHVFLRCFERARADVAAGVDTESVWWELRRREWCGAAAVAGYLEGLASTRERAGWRRYGAVA